MTSSLVHRTVAVRYLASICVLTVVFGAWYMRRQTAVAAPSTAPLHGAPPQLSWAASALGPPAGSTITVNNTSDVANSNDGLCTLREAITAANSNIASGMTAGECVAGSATDPDTISLAGVTGVITITSALPTITSDMTISGPGLSQLSISGNNSFRVFNITLPSPGTVNFSGLTISNGRAHMDVGGGIYNQNTADVNVTESSISNNFAVLGGGIANSSTGKFTITNSTLSNNSANTAAGCYNGSSGTLNIIGSTLNNNVAGSGGGSGNGGAVITGANLTVINSTLHANSAQGGGAAIYVSGPDAIINISNSTLTQNFAVAGGGGGVHNINNGVVRIINTIIAHNGSGFGSDLSGSFVSLGHNLVTNGVGVTGFTIGTNNSNGDLVGASWAPVFSLLGPLQNNGGPTQTRALLPGSQAIDAGDNCVVLASGNGGCLSTPLSTDQRGVARQTNLTVDIGAFESRGFTISATSGTPQSTAVHTLFAPLIATVISPAGDPVAGGLVNFHSPTSGPSAELATGVSSIQESIDSIGHAIALPSANGLAGGPYNVTATIHRTNSSTSFSLTNNQAPTNTVLTSSANPSDLTQSVTFRATVTSTGPLTGTVQFKIDGSNAGSPVTLSGGLATLTTTALAAGTHSVTADYSGDANFLASSATLAGGQVVRPPPTLTINDVSFTEGQTGTKLIFFTVTSSAASNLQVSVDFATASSTASSPSDYLAASGTLTFVPGQVIRTMFVTINGDEILEPDETFTMSLSNASNATIARAQGTGTILNDDAPVVLTEEKTNHAIALDSVTQLRDPFSLKTDHNFSADRRRRVALFVWRLFLPGDTISDVIVQGEDEQSIIYPLTVEHIAPVGGLDGVNQIIVMLPEQVVGAPRPLWITVKIRGLTSNRAFISVTP